MSLRQLASMGFVVWTWGGCAAVQGAQQGVTDTTSGITSAEGTAKNTKDLADQHKKMVDDARKKAGGGGGDAAAGGKADPDGDGSRATAKEAKVNEVVTDEVDPAKNDVADWRVYSLGGKPAIFTVRLNWDEPTANLNVDVYDAFGANLASSHGQGSTPVPARKLLSQIDEPGKYYVKISSARGASVYTMEAKWAGGNAPGPAVAKSEAPAPAPIPAGGGTTAPGPAVAAAPPVAGAPAAPAVPAADDPMHPRGKIIQSYRGEDGQLVLYIDKGSASKVAAGMTGLILEGADGDKLLDGGTFRIQKVVDATKSIGKSSMTKIGKNNRCIINLIK